jgi:hypothetical protein
VNAVAADHLVKLLLRAGIASSAPMGIGLELTFDRRRN